VVGIRESDVASAGIEMSAGISPSQCQSRLHRTADAVDAGNGNGHTYWGNWVYLHRQLGRRGHGNEASFSAWESAQGRRRDLAEPAKILLEHHFGYA
jgi:hypothetical protein